MRQTTVLLMRQIYQHCSATDPVSLVLDVQQAPRCLRRLPYAITAQVAARRLRLLVCLALEGDALVQGPRASKWSDPVAASASAPSRLPGGLEGDALCRGPRASRVVRPVSLVAASASAPSRLPGGLEGDALLVPDAAGDRAAAAANLPTLGSATDPVAVSASALLAAGGFEGDALGRRPWASRVGGRGRRDWLAPDAADDRAAAAANLPTLGSATDPVAVSASAPSRLPGGFEGDAVGQAAVGVESGSDPVAASASAPSRLPGGLEGDALVQGPRASRPGLWDCALRMPVCRPIHSSYSWLPMRLQRERGTLPLQEGQGPCLREILSCRHSSWNARWVLRKILRGRSMRL
eukprot:tig00000219_g19538.t2